MKTMSLSRLEVGNLIRTSIDQFGEDAWFINNGWCHAFAIGIARMIGPEARIVSSLYDYREGTFPGHRWVEYRGFQFDAEDPDGVSDPRHMQYHRRLRAIVDSPEDQHEIDAVREALGRDPIYYGSAPEVYDAAPTVTFIGL